ncbi:MAG TPA: metalloregulator ArsR/SmtB family transcription factor [Terriglobales bacterium]
MVEHSQSGELDRVFSALADPTRRAILRRLTHRPATINEIAKPFRVSLNAISKHVMTLERAGILRRQIKGREHYCWIEPGPLREANEWLEHYRQFWEQRLDALEAYVARRYQASGRKIRHGNKC